MKLSTNWKTVFIEEYAGHPIRVALNLFIMGAGGVLIGHYLLGAPASPLLVGGAMAPGLVAVIAAGIMKHQVQR